MKKGNVVLNRRHYKHGVVILKWALGFELGFELGALERIKGVLSDAKSVESFSRLCNRESGTVVCRSDVFIALDGKSVKSVKANDALGGESA